MVAVDVEELPLSALGCCRPLNLEVRDEKEVAPAVIAHPVQDCDSGTVEDVLVNSFSANTECLKLCEVINIRSCLPFDTS